MGLVLLGAPAWAAESALGRWDLTLENGRTPSWIDIVREGGKYRGSFLGTGGSPFWLDEVKVEGDRVEFKVGDQMWTGKIKGDVISGTHGKNNSKFTGRRFVPQLDLNGTWAVEGKEKATLHISQQGRKVAGQLNAEKKREPLRDVKLSGYALSFVADGQQYSATVKGDVLDGSKTAGGKQEPFFARRERQWGQAIELFNGEDTAGWKPLEQGREFKWKVVDGILTCPGGSANIVSERRFKDFKLHVEFRLSHHSNSGVYLRGRHEIQVEDSAGKPTNEHICGAVYGRIAPSENVTKPAGEWQTYDITLVDHYVTIVQNGTTIIDNQEIAGITGGAIDSNENEPGPIYLQGDHTAIEYRKITITPAKTAGAPAIAG
jgi:hypothetical protein